MHTDIAVRKFADSHYHSKLDKYDKPKKFCKKKIQGFEYTETHRLLQSSDL